MFNLDQYDLILRVADRMGSLFQQRRLRAFATLFAVGLGVSLLVSACNPAPNSSTVANSPDAATPTEQTRVLRVGYQKSSTVLNLLKHQGTLEETLEPEGIRVEWSEFAAGPQMLEALNVGSIDFAYTGETPPVFAQAADAPLVYVAYEPVGGSAEAILVREDSPIQTVEDLRGKTVALNKGSNVHYLLVRALEEAGIEYSDIETVFLPPGDARPAFEQGVLDAWVIWDPFQAAAETSTNARILVDGKDLVANHGYFLSTRNYVDQNPDLIEKILEELRKTADWAEDNSSEVASFLSDELGIDKPSLELAETRRGYGVRPITDEIVKGQQQIADTFYNLKLIPKQIKVADVVWKG